MLSRPNVDSRFFTVEVDSVVEAKTVNILLMSSLREMCDYLVCMNSEWSGYSDERRVMYQIIGTEEQIQACRKKVRRLSRGRPKFDIVFDTHNTGVI